MDEQLEVAFEGTGVESQSETPVSPGSEAGTAEEKAEEALPREVNAESGIPISENNTLLFFWDGIIPRIYSLKV